MRFFFFSVGVPHTSLSSILWFEVNRLRTVSASWEVTSAVVVLALILVLQPRNPFQVFFCCFFWFTLLFTLERSRCRPRCRRTARKGSGGGVAAWLRRCGGGPPARRRHPTPSAPAPPSPDAPARCGRRRPDRCRAPPDDTQWPARERNRYMLLYWEVWG